MHIAIDIDDTITRCPEFFKIMSSAPKAAGHRVYIITYREDREGTERELAEYGISYHELLLAPNDELDRIGFFGWKAEACRERKIDILFEDMPEVINELDGSTIAFMPVDQDLGTVTYEEDARPSGSE